MPTACVLKTEPSDYSKANKLFADSPLIRQGRLSVVPLNAAQFKFLTGP